MLCSADAKFALAVLMCAPVVHLLCASAVGVCFVFALIA